MLYICYKNTKKENEETVLMSAIFIIMMSIAMLPAVLKEFLWIEIKFTIWIPFMLTIYMLIKIMKPIVIEDLKKNK